MSRRECDRQLGDLLVDRHYLCREVACLTKKIQVISTALSEVATHLKEGTGVDHFEKLERNFLSKGGADLPRSLAVCKKSLRKLADTEAGIEKFDKILDRTSPC